MKQGNREKNNQFPCAMHDIPDHSIKECRSWVSFAGELAQQSGHSKQHQWMKRYIVEISTTEGTLLSSHSLLILNTRNTSAIRIFIIQTVVTKPKMYKSLELI